MPALYIPSRVFRIVSDVSLPRAQVTEVGLGALLARGLVNVDVTGCRGLRRETKAAASIGLPALRSQLQRAGFIHR